MSNLRQTAQRALKAMEDGEDRADMIEFSDALIALRAALAEPEQEPDGISWLKRDSGYFTAPTPRKPLTDEEIEALHAENEALKAKIEQYSAAVKYPLIFNGLSGNEIEEGLLRSKYALETAKAWRDGVWWAYEKLKDKNT